MSDCLKFSSSMTGSTNLGPLKPQEDTSLLPSRSLPSKRHTTTRSAPTARNCHRHPSRTMTLTPSAGQSMQLTPLWEHVVRTRRFPSEVDTQQTFLEISERLRDPEWEVRQHALRVLMDVLPTLNADVVDKAMQPVVPELINNLGHPAPAVRKGALDTLRVYLVYSHDKDNVVKNILHEGLNRPEPHDAFQTNVTTGIILSAPSLLFPASCSPPPAEQLVKDTTIALASRLAQVPHQEAVLKSLMKIRDAVGTQLYDDYLASYDPKLRKNIELLCKIYNVKSNRGTRRKEEESKEVCKLEREDRSMDRTWESDSDTSGIAEEEDETGSMPPARVVLETEIKFNEETAITMTILEEKDEESESDKDAESGTDLRNDMEALEVKDPNDRRRTPRRVHFGGEIVKLRTPDSDETESLELNRKTRIPLPVSPATKMPAERPRRRPSSQPCSPLRESRRPRRVSRSVSSSPKREVYTHNAELSPKKGILARTSSPVFIIKPVEQHSAGRKRRSVASRNNEGKGAGDKEWATSEFSSGNVEDVLKASKVDPRITTLVEKERVLRNNENPEITSSDGLLEAKDPQDTRNSTMNDKQFLNKKESFEGGMKRSNRKTDNTNVSSLKRIVDGNQSTNISSTTKGEDKSSAKQAQKNTALAQNKNMFEVFPRQERNYILMELSSPERKTSAEKKITSEAVTLPEEERTIQGEVLSSDIQNDLTEHPESMNDVGIEEFTVGVSMEEKRISEIGAEDRSENIVEVIAEATRKKSAENPRAFPTDEAKSRIVKSEVTFVDAEKSSETKCERSSNNATKNAAVVNAENPGSDVKTINSGDNERIPWKGRGKDRADAIEGSVTRNGREGESKPKEPNWEELGLVDQEVLEDLHNKDDWRARVRGLERVASALRTSSALIAIESRLGSLLHAVLGCERSCRVAAAGLAVAKVVVAGVNEDALRKRLPQLAWGLARQGGASAAQLARITMLRLRPTLLLEQLLQPQCLSARNAKTRENALQLLIFSLVTFPSTEFKMETVANKVSAIVADRRRRVRQAALDTLAVLAQIYESEEVLTAGRRAAEGRHDGEAMVSAIRARLARKSLPMVSADGLVVYGLQISPTMQIATGPDVDWIVAGSGSVSPGTGRVRGQIIATTKSEKKKFSRNATTKIRESSWNERPDFVARGVGLQSKTEKPVAWQIVPTENQDDIHLDDELGAREDRNVATDIYNGKNSDLSVKSKDESRSSCESGAELTNYRDTVKSNERKAIHGIVDGVSKKKESFNLKPESKIPVLFSRDRTTGMKTSGTAGDKSGNVDAINSNSRRRTKDIPENSNGRLRSREDATGSYAVMYQRRKRLQQESASNVTSAVHDVNPSIDSQYGAHRSASSAKSSSNAAYANVTEGPNQSFSEITSQNSQKFIAGRRSSGSSNSKSRESGTSTTEGGQRPVLINLPRQAHPVYKLYSAVYRPHGRFADESSFRALQTAPAPLSRVYCQDYDRHTAEDEDRILLNPLHAKMDARTKDVSAQKVSEVELRSSEAQTNERFVLENRKESPCRRRLRSLSPSQLYHLRQHVRLATDDFHTMSMYDIYCAWPSTAKEEDNEHVAKKADVKHVAKKSDSKHVVKEDYDNRVINEEYDNHVIKEDDDNHVIKEEYGSRVIKDDDENRTTTKSDNNYLTRKSYKNHAVQEDDDKYVLQEDDYEHVAKSIEEKSEFWLAGTALRCCPCVFRCRRPVGVEKENEKTPSTTVTTANTTPVIALRLNQSTDTIDKTAVNEEEYNEKNKRHFLPELSSYRAQALDPRFDVDDHERSFSKSTSSSSSDISRGNDQYKDQGVHAEGIYSNSNSRSSTPHIQDPNTAFDVITQQSNSRGRDTVDSYMPLDGKELGLPLVSSNFSLDDDASKDWSSEEDIKLENRVDSKSSDRSEFLYGNEHLNSVGLDISERIESERSVRRKSIVSVVSSERVLGNEVRHESIRSTDFYDILGSPLKDAGALPNSDLLYSSRSPSRNSNQFAASRSSSRSNSRSSIHKLALEQNQDLQTDSSEERMISSTLPDENGSFQSLDNLAFRRGSNAAESPTIVIASRPHSTEAKDFMTNTIDVISNVVLHKENIHEALQSTEESSVNDILEEVHSKDSASETNTEPGILKIEQAHPMEPVNPQRKISKVPRSTGRLRANTKGNSGHSTEKSKPIVQQCFAQLENKDWEVTMKGLKVLSQIAKQNPEYLDVCTAGTIGRLLGRHIRNLRSQVARTACLAAGDIFSSRIRGIDQDIDDIAGPLLHRTADTNRFLRADSNAALDRMIEHLPPHRTIGVIVQRGGNHQNAIVRAATARLLSEVVDRVGPEHAMILPRDVKDKLLNAGAKLLMDGNLDARNHAKKMFRRLTRCEGFRRALTDAVPETTLRHIDKTLKSL